jgi:Leucine-rich repeat (LRR) protein
LALEDLYESTDGNDWLWFKNETEYGIPWNFTNPNPCSDRWQGITCSSLYTDGYLHVETISLSSFNMVGVLPSSLGSLTSMQMVDFMNNTLHGGIPAAFGEMGNLSCLNLGYNQLTGTIPRQLSDLDNLRTLYLNRNLLNGSLPTLDSCTELNVLFISENRLTGTIPASYASLTLLSVLRLGDNLLYGSIPAFLGELKNITLFGLFQNAFTGTLPDLSGLTQLTSFVVAANLLDGAVPAYFGGLPSLQQLVLTDNKYTGPIPVELSESQTLEQLYLNINKLTGTLPEQLGELSTLAVLRVDNNQLTGTVAAGICTATNLTILSLASNHFVGTLPTELGALARLERFDVSYNEFTGTIPDSVCNWNAVQNFTATNCHFSGSIPAAIGEMAHLQYLSLHDNQLTSTLPASLKLASSLVVLLLHNNQLSGTLSGVFNASTQRQLSTIQLSENGFTGDIPEDLFALPQLETVILGTNCFHGELPEAICDATKLQTLSLNGLSTGAPCRTPLFPLISEAYTTSHPVHHGIPQCLFEMETINTLQISGNGIGGTLPTDAVLGPNLIALELSHNKLTGTIPPAFQRRIWYDLDLSSNKLKGTLNGDFATEAPALTNSTLTHFEFQFNSTNIQEKYHTAASLVLSENRLSHLVPNILVGMQNISILRGNLFGCDFDHADLPREDGAEYTYNCGSNSFNASYTAYMCSVGVVLVIATMLYYGRERVKWYADIVALVRTFKKWISVSHLYRDASGQPIMRRYESVLLMADRLCMVGVYCTAYILVVQLSLCSAFNRYYSTHTYEYAWSVSAAFLSGNAAASMLILSFTALLVLLLYCFRRAMKKMVHVYAEAKRHDSIRSVSLVAEDHDTATSLQKMAIFVVYLIVNISIVSVAHVLYVYAIMSGTLLYKTLAQLALSAFRLMWSTYGAQFFIRGAQGQLAKSEEEVWKVKDARFFAVQVLVQLLNLVVIPCLVVLAISPDCFHYALTAAPTSVSLYFYDDCHIYGTSVGCVAPDYRIAPVVHVQLRVQRESDHVLRAGVRVHGSLHDLP